MSSLVAVALLALVNNAGGVGSVDEDQTLGDIGSGGQSRSQEPCRDLANMGKEGTGI